MKKIYKILTILLLLVAIIIAFLVFDFVLNHDIIYTVLVIVLIIISIYLYKKCQAKVSQRPKPILGFFKKYWYDMKCKYLVVAFAIPATVIGVEFIKWISI